MTEPTPAKCHCGSISWERRIEERRFICASCKRPLWQPIETAPRDGTAVLVYDDGFFQTAAWYVGLRRAGWTNAADSWLGDVTHWMPIPDGPKLDDCLTTYDNGE